MSPEQVMGKPVDARSDIFSLGVVFYELLTGRKPFSGESAAELFRNIVKEVPKSPRQIDSSIPISISEIVLKSLAKEPSQRFQTADSFVGALAGANLRPRQNKAAETGESMPLGRGDIDIEVARRTAATSSSSAEHLRSRWFAFAFAVLLVCFVLVLFGWMPFLRGFGEHGRGGPKLLAALAAALVLWLLWRSYTVRERRGRWGDLPSLMGSVPPQSSDSRVTGQFQPNGQEPTLRRPEPEDREATQDELIPYSPPPFGSVEVLTYPNAIAWLISLGDQDHGREIRLGDMSLSAGLMTTT
jgi:serine/threonine protein kinase